MQLELVLARMGMLARTAIKYQWPISARWTWDLQWRNSSNRMSQQYFGRDFTWEMAQEADCIAWRLHRAEQAAQRKGKGTGQPETDARSQTFDV